MMKDKENNTYQIWSPTTYICPKHGETEFAISSNIKDYEGVWCQICAVELLDKLGVNRVTKKDTSDK